MCPFGFFRVFQVNTSINVLFYLRFPSDLKPIFGEVAFDFCRISLSLLLYSFKCILLSIEFAIRTPIIHWHSYFTVDKFCGFSLSFCSVVVVVDSDKIIKQSEERLSVLSFPGEERLSVLSACFSACWNFVAYIISVNSLWISFDPQKIARLVDEVSPLSDISKL